MIRKNYTDWEQISFSCIPAGKFGLIFSEGAVISMSILTILCQLLHHFRPNFILSKGPGVIFLVANLYILAQNRERIAHNFSLNRTSGSTAYSCLVRIMSPFSIKWQVSLTLQMEFSISTECKFFLACSRELQTEQNSY